MGCCHSSQAERHCHPCLLVGSVIRGKPVAVFNRRVIALWTESQSVEEGSLTAVEAGKGKIMCEEYLGRVKVKIEEQISAVHKWAENAMKEGGDDEAIFKKVEAEMVANKTSGNDVEVVELDVYRAYVVNRLREHVFVATKPSSLP